MAYEAPAQLTDAAKLSEARDRFKRCAEAEDPQRKVILACKQFRALNQWPDEIKIQRQGGPALQGQAAQPPRPMLTIDRISQPTRQVSNSVKAANFSINVQPNGYGADDETAKIYKGLLRWIQNRARPEAPVDWAADGAAEGGLGWFRIRADYAVHDLPPDGVFGPEYGDQDLCLERIKNNLAVYCDPAAVKPTRSDARYMFVTEDVPKDEFKRRWPNANITSLDEFRATGDDSDKQGWVSEDSYRVAEYWCVTYKPHDLIEVKGPAGQTVWMLSADVPKDTPKAMRGKTRTLLKPVVTMETITATEILDKADWLGRRIPLFPIIGEELDVDGLTVLRGVIQPAMDAQRMVNYMYSAAIETVALAPKAPLIVAEGQVERYASIWQNANRFNYSYLPYTPISLMGTMVPPPGRDQAEPAIQAMVLMLDRSEEGIKATTAIYDQSLGRSDRDDSGKKVLALQKQSELTNSNYIDNVVTTLTEAGDELVYLLPKYYDRPERVVQILGIDDQPEQVMLGVPFQKTPQGPQKVAGVTPEMVKAQQGLAQFYDLSKGRYAVTVTVGKSHTTKRAEGSEAMLELVSAQPNLLQVFGDLLFRDLDFPGAPEISERMKKFLLPQLQQDGEQPNPQQLQQQLQQMAQMVDLLTKELEGKNRLIETEQIKADRDASLEREKQAGDTARAAEKAKVDIYLAKLKIVADLLKTRATLEQKQTEQMIDVTVGQVDREVELAGQREERQAASDRADKDRDFQASEAERDRQQTSQEADMGRAHEKTLAEQAATSQNDES